MTETTSRDLIQRLADELQIWIDSAEFDIDPDEQALIDEAHAFLDQPEPEGPTEEEINDLSTAQKALAAFNRRYESCGWFDDDWARQCFAAALEAVADQVVPYEKAPNLMRSPDLERLAQRQHTRTQLLAIAAELRDTTTTETL